MRSIVCLLSSMIILLLAGCREQKQLTVISNDDKSAESVYLTNDQHGNPVVVWTEKDNAKLTLYYSISKNNGETFSDKVSLPLTSDVATHAEGMPKVAFKKDGTVIAAYEKKSPTKENKYAGSIYYVISSDGGKSWTPETFLHNDTIAGRSRSYFDIERLPDGEIGASWLDIKLNQETGGRSVRFARTSHSRGFDNEILVDSSACQCCRIDVYSDMTGKVNIAYRGLSKGNMGKTIRDMMLATSANGGETFSTPRKISQDNWEIDGCPHTGPSLCSSKAGLFSLWYTEGNGTGIYYCFKDEKTNSFSDRKLVSDVGLHPQLSADENRFVMVWEENSGNDDKRFTQILYQSNDGLEAKKATLTPENTNAFSPVLTQTRDGFVVAFLMETGKDVAMCTTKL